MNKNKNVIFKISLGAIFAALSVVIKLLIDPLFSGQAFGTPFYGIPLILSGLFLGPIYGLIVGIVADTAGGLGLGHYLPLFVFSSVAWSVIPSLFTKKPQGVKWFLIIYLTYIVSTAFNTVAIWYHFSKNAAKANIYLRVGLIPIFGFIMGWVTQTLFNRLEEFLPARLNPKNPSDI